MGSTGAIVYVRPRLVTASIANRVTGAIAYVALRNSTGQFTSTGIIAGRNLRNKRAMLPPRSTPLMDAAGLISQEWWNWFGFLNGTFLRARIGPTMPDLENAITTAQVQSASSEASTASLAQQVAAIAQSVLAMREVTIAAAAPGAPSIPVPPLEPQVLPTGTGELAGGDSGGGGSSGGDAGGGGD